MHRLEEQTALVKVIEGERARITAWAHDIQAERLVADSMNKAHVEMLHADLVCFGIGLRGRDAWC